MTINGNSRIPQLSLIKSISFHLCDFSQSASDDLLIDTYIKWQYTHGIMFLYLSTCAELVESTLGHSGENINLIKYLNTEVLVTTFIILYFTIGSILSSWSLSANDKTSMPKVKNVPSKNLSIKNIWPEQTRAVDLNYS